VCDLHEPFRAAFDDQLPHATQVADPLHVVAVGTRVIDRARRRVQNETLGHRGRAADPLYRARKLLTPADERLDDRGRRKLRGLLAPATPTATSPPPTTPRNACASSTPSGANPTQRAAGSAHSSPTSPTSPEPSYGAWPAPCAAGGPDPGLAHHRRLERPHRGPQRPHQEGEADRCRVPELRPLPTTRPAPHRRLQRRLLAT
jgi:hypothetical protein